VEKAVPPTADTVSALPLRAAVTALPDPAVPLVEELTPTLDAWSAFHRLAHLPHALFLDSALPHRQLGRYSFITADPFDWLRSRGQRAWMASRPQPLEACDPLALLAEQLARYRAEPLPGLPPFQGGAAGLFGYDLCHHLERLPRPPHDEFAAPDLAAGFYDWVLAYDHEADRAWLVSTGFPETDPRRRRQRAEQRLRAVRGCLHQNRTPAQPRNVPDPITPCRQWPVPWLSGLTSNLERANYLATVRRAVEYVHAGDCFQVNIAQRLLWPADGAALDLYGRLRQRNAAPFAGYFDLGDFVIASASPERLLRCDGVGLESRPIKGTRPRGLTPEEDLGRKDELRQSGKDRAENVMIVDLVRNDLGRVCRYGSVRVASVCQVETYEYVHHLVSVVQGRLRDGLGPIDALRAVFPGGSVTGAPKIRAMEIIAELEPTARGPYCGSLGYVGFDGRMDTSILIRTFTIGRGWVQFPVGGGIVADSVPEREYEETWHKAKGMVGALREA
jgi:para-aminobenzoate synthetase component I